MRSALLFTAVVFGPLLIALALPALFLLPSGVLMLLIGTLDPTVPLSEAAGYSAWGIGPLLGCAALALIGLGLHSLYQRPGWRKPVWIAAWLAYTAGLFAAAWLGTIVLTSLGASDYPPGEFLRWTAVVAAVLSLALQPAVGLWLLISSRILGRLGVTTSTQ